jgi:hypothetical protein
MERIASLPRHPPNEVLTKPQNSLRTSPEFSKFLARHPRGYRESDTPAPLGLRAGGFFLPKSEP